MRYFLAVNNKQLGICLRMLYAERIQGFVETVMNGKGISAKLLRTDVIMKKANG